MSLPKDLLDQLLTGYMDDALSDDERARVEQLLRSNPEIASELAQLQELRQSLKAIAQADSAIKLEHGFADRVLGAAVARAQAEGLGDDHPLVRLAEQPSTTTHASATPSSSWRLAAVLVGLAASIAIAVITLRPDPRGPEGFAQIPKPGVPSVPVPSVPDPSVPDPVLEIVTEPAPAPREMIVNSDPVTRSVEDPAPQPEVIRPAVPPVESIASSQDSSAKDIQPATEMKPALVASGIIIYHVRRTDAGRESDAVAEAMKVASIIPTTEKRITEEIAGFVNDNVQPATAKFSVLYLQAPVKQLDKFYLTLQNDDAGIESVGMSLAMDAPTMELVSTVSADPKMVRHTSLELVSDNGVVEQLSSRLGQLPFVPLDAMPSLANGPNPMGQILVLVE